MTTQEATQNYFTRLKNKNLQTTSTCLFGKTGFRVSKIGFGGYRIHHNSIEHAKALRYALLNGFNLIDTSSNYTNGGSEMLIGNLLQEMIDRDEISRDEIVLISKVGYVQGQNLQVAQQHAADGQPFPDMVTYMDGCWHCIHPEFLEDQLSRTLERLNQPFLDIYLLHNPEYFLSHQKKRNGVDLQKARQDYYRRIKLAFEWLESKVAEGKIKAYGISSNTFAYPSNEFEFTSLEKTLAIAESISSDHFYRVIQFPFNLFETGACFEKNQLKNSRTLLDVARDNQLATLVNRPLNAMVGNDMIRLASFRENPAEEIKTSFAQLLSTLTDLEHQFHDKYLSFMPKEIPLDNFKQVFSLSQSLSQATTRFQTWEHWDHVRQNIIIPQTFSTLNYLRDKLKDNADWSNWSNRYAQTLLTLLETINRHYENIAQKRSARLFRFLENLEHTLRDSETLSQQVLRTLTSVDGVNCVLLGMRRTPYVEDALAALQQTAVEDPEKILTTCHKTISTIIHNNAPKQ